MEWLGKTTVCLGAQVSQCPPRPRTPDPGNLACGLDAQLLLSSLVFIVQQQRCTGQGSCVCSGETALWRLLLVLVGSTLVALSAALCCSCRAGSAWPSGCPWALFKGIPTSGVSVRLRSAVVWLIRCLKGLLDPPHMGCLTSHLSCSLGLVLNISFHSSQP